MQKGKRGKGKGKKKRRKGALRKGSSPSTCAVPYFPMLPYRFYILNETKEREEEGGGKVEK